MSKKDTDAWRDEGCCATEINIISVNEKKSLNFKNKLRTMQISRKTSELLQVITVKIVLTIISAMKKIFFQTLRGYCLFFSDEQCSPEKHQMADLLITYLTFGTIC